MILVKDKQGKVTAIEGLDYCEAMDQTCIKCGKVLNWQPEEDDLEGADCCGIRYILYAMKYDIEVYYKEGENGEEKAGQ